MGRVYEYDWPERNTLELYADQDIRYLESKKEVDPDEDQDQ